MMNSVTAPYDECIKYLVDNIKLDPHFKDFFFWAQKNNIPVVVLSSGMIPIIRALLEKHIGPESKNIEVVANDVTVKPGKKTINEKDGWDIVFHDDR